MRHCLYIGLLAQAELADVGPYAVQDPIILLDHDDHLSHRTSVTK